MMRATLVGLLTVASCPAAALAPQVESRAELVSILKETFAEQDRDSDGALTWAELEADMKAQEALLGIAPSTDTARAEFKLEDADGDGRVTFAEYGSKPTAYFDCFDRDRDGIVSPDEESASSPTCDSEGESPSAG